MFQLTESQVAEYNRNGVLVCEAFFDDDLMQAARDAVDCLLKRDNLSEVAELEPEDDRQARRIWSPLEKDPLFEEIALDNQLATAISQLIGNDILLQYTKLNVKPPKVGSIVEWHQDFAFYPHTNSDMLSCMVYLDDADDENSCLQVALGSHRLGLVSHEVEGYFGGKITDLKAVGVSPDSIVSCGGKAGTVVFLHCLAAHASDRNLSDRFRRAFIPAYRAADAFPIYYGPHSAHNEPNIRLVRGSLARSARCEQQRWPLPIAAAEFNSLYQIQEGAHLATQSKSKTGYFSHEWNAEPAT